tara:strand:- start:96 stop:626 length:531 start_codon:yes stop_codon:yes gene_type:complete
MKLNNKNIIFIGMPSVGKSYWGKIISDIYNINFIDGDIIIEKIYGKKLGIILKELGEEKFCKYEEEILCNLKCRNTIISPGGSVIYSDKIINHFKKLNSIIIYLHLDIETLRNRLGNLKKRGVVIKPGMTFNDLFKERSKLYKKYSDYKVDCTNKNYDEILSEIKHIISRFILSNL